MATTFYDFNAPTNGSGTAASPKNAWATPGNGDVIKLKRGDTWTRATQLNLSTFTGLTFEAWYNADGSDDPSQPKPVITHTAASTFAWNFQGDGVHTIRDLHFVNCSTNASGGVIGSGLVAASGVHASIEVHGCDFDGISGNAIRFSGTSTVSAARCVVKYCNFDNIGEDCIYGGALYYEVGYCRMTRLSMATSTGDGVGFLGTNPTKAWVHHNYIDHSDVDSKHCIIIDTETTDAGLSIIEDNTLIGYGSTTAEASLHTVVNGDGKMIIRRNTIYSSGIAINLDGNASEVYSNRIVVRNSRAASKNIISVSASNCAVTNNTIVAVSDLPASTNGVIQAASETGNSVKNNCFVGIPVAVKSDNGSNNPAVANNALWNVTTPYTNGTTGPFTSTGDVTTDPLLTADYRLTPASPLLQAGTHLGYRRDINGRQRPNPPSIGAYDVARLVFA